MTTTPSKWAKERAAMLMHDRADVNQHHETIARALDAARREALEEAAEVCKGRANKCRLMCGADAEGQLLGSADAIRALMEKEPSR